MAKKFLWGRKIETSLFLKQTLNTSKNRSECVSTETHFACIRFICFLDFVFSRERKIDAI